MLSLITLAATVPLLATSTIQLQDQSQKTKDEKVDEFKTDKCHLKARASLRMGVKRQGQMNNMEVVLQDGNLFLRPSGLSRLHPFTGYFLPYPEKGYDGIVTTIDSQNMLNWIFIDRDTYRLRYGVRADAQPNLTGPMSLKFASMEDEWRIAFEGWEGFVAVEEYEDFWSIYFDRDDNGLKGRNEGKAVIEIELIRTPMETTPAETSNASSDRAESSDGVETEYANALLDP